MEVLLNISYQQLKSMVQAQHPFLLNQINLISIQYAEAKGQFQIVISSPQHVPIVESIQWI